MAGIYLQKVVSCVNDQLHSLTIFYHYDFSSLQTNLFPTESAIMKCDIWYSGLEWLDLCSGKLKLISPTVDFPVCSTLNHRTRKGKKYSILVCVFSLWEPEAY